MKKFKISYYLYYNDQWNDFDKEVVGNSSEEVLSIFKEENRMARDITIKEI